MYGEGYCSESGKDGDMITIKDYKKGDLDVIKANPLDTEVGVLTDENIGNIAFSAYVGDALVGCGGFRVFWFGVAEAWLMLPKSSKDKSFCEKAEAVMLLYQKLERLMKEHKLWRVGALVRTDFPKAIKLVEALGFKWEGLMRKYAPDGTDRLIYGKII